MTHDLVHTNLHDFVQTNLDPLNLLLRLLSRNEGFILVPIVCPTWPLARKLSQWLAEHYTPTLLNPTDGAWLQTANELLAIEPPPDGVALLYGHSSKHPDQVRGLRFINEKRDVIAHHLKRPLLWCGPSSFHEQCWTAMPDFWSIRALSVHLKRPDLAARTLEHTQESLMSYRWMDERTLRDHRDLLDRALAQGDERIAARAHLNLAEGYISRGETAEARRHVNALAWDALTPEQQRRAEQARALVSARGGWTPTDSELRELLADLYPTQADAKRMVRDAGLKPSRVAFSGASINTWQSILDEALKHDGAKARLVKNALKEYPDQPLLQRVAAGLTIASPNAARAGGGSSGDHIVVINNGQMAGVAVGAGAQALVEGAVAQTTSPSALDDHISQPLGTSPAVLLNARHCVVAFHRASRDRELTWLRSWCDRDAPIQAQLMTGPGGSGKTRLMLEWCRELRDEGWRAGFLLPASELTPKALLALVQPDQPVLVVIDYAETRQDLAATLDRLIRYAQRTRCTLRVLLLAREVADWWTILKGRESKVGELLSSVLPMRLHRIEAQGALRSELFQSALSSFADKLELPIPDGPEPDLTPPRYGRPLYIHMMALVQLHGWSLAEDSSRALLNTILDHEQRFWRPRTSQPTPIDGFEFAAQRVVAALTLRGGSPSRDEALALTEQVRGPSPPEPFVSHLRRLYRGDNPQHTFLTGLEPDILGETLVVRVLCGAEDFDCDTPPDVLALALKDATSEQLTTAMVVLGRIALHSKDGERWCRQLLKRDVGRLAEPTFKAALSLGRESPFAPLGLLLAQALEHTDDIELAERLETTIPKQTVSFRELALWATQTRLRHASEASEKARLFNSLSNRLNDLGRHVEALSATQEAVALYKDLVQREPDVHLRNLADVLNTQGVTLRALGRLDDALDVVQEANRTRRRFLAQNPDAPKDSLATELNNLGVFLRESGRLEKALEVTEEAITLHRSMSDQDSRVDFAGALSNLSVIRRDMGDSTGAIEASEEAVHVFRQLADSNRDAFLPHLAMGLMNLGIMYGAERYVQRREAMEEAVRIYRQLNQVYPTLFQRELANGLSNLSGALGSSRRSQEALALAQEAVAIYRHLSDANPESYRPALANALHNLSIAQGVLKHHAESLESSKEATEAYEQLARERPAMFLPRLALALGHLSMAHTSLGHHQEALQPIHRAVQLLNQLFPARPHALAEPLAQSLAQMERCLKLLNRQPEDEPIYASALQALRSHQPQDATSEAPVDQDATSEASVDSLNPNTPGC